MSARVCLLRGDDLGEELLVHARELLGAVAGHLDLVEHPLGLGAFERAGRALPEPTLEAARGADACLLVAVRSPLEPTPGYRSPVVELRRELDLFANLRPVRSLPAGCPAARPGAPPVDLLVVRENTEGLYAGREHRAGGRAVAERVVTEAASRRIARVAGEAARSRRSRVCVVHKSNVLRTTCGLFRSVVLDELGRVGGLEVEELLVDHAAYKLAAEPERFDVLVTTNLFGDILSDVAAHAGGGLGLVASANLGDEAALFEPVHGAGSDIAGRGTANPVATLRSCAALLEHVGCGDAAARVTRAIEETLAEGPWTPDLGGAAGTAEVTGAVLARCGGGAGRGPGAAATREHVPSARGPSVR